MERWTPYRSWSSDAPTQRSLGLSRAIGKLFQPWHGVDLVLKERKKREMMGRRNSQGRQKEGKRRKQKWTRQEKALGSTEPTLVHLSLCSQLGYPLLHSPDQSFNKNTQTQQEISSVLAAWDIFRQSSKNCHCQRRWTQQKDVLSRINIWDLEEKKNVDHKARIQ